MTTLNISGISQKDFEQRLLKTIEGTLGSPIVKHKNKVLSKAMTTLLHNGNSVGQNEHNLSQFFNNDETPIKDSFYWVASEDYKHEGCVSNQIEIYEADSELEVIALMEQSVIEYLADWIEHSINIEELHNVIKHLGNDYIQKFYDENDVNSDNIEGHEITEILTILSNTTNIAIRKATFNYITDLSNIEGSHKIEQVKDKNPLIGKRKASDMFVMKEQKSIKLFKIILKSFDYNESSQNLSLQDVKVTIQTSEEEHNKELIELFKSYGDQNDGTFFALADAYEDLLEENELEANSFSDFDELTDWIIKQNVSPNKIVEHLKELTMDYFEIETSDEYKDIKNSDFLN